MDELEKHFSGKFKEKAVVLEKAGDFWTVRSNSLRDCNAPGLWILYGKAEKDDSAVADALEVGQVADIANEICRDIRIINNLRNHPWQPRFIKANKIFH